MAEVRPQINNPNLGTVQEAQNAKLAELAFDVNGQESAGKKLSREARSAKTPSQVDSITQRIRFKPPDISGLMHNVDRGFSTSTPPVADFFPGQKKDNRGQKTEAPKSLHDQVGATVTLAHNYLEKGYEGMSDGEQGVIRAEALMALERLWPEAVTLIDQSIRNNPNVQQQALNKGFQAAEMMGLAMPHDATMREEVRRAVAAGKDQISTEIISDPAFMEEVHKAVTQFNEQQPAKQGPDLGVQVRTAEAEVAKLDRDITFQEKQFNSDIDFNKKELASVQDSLDRLANNQVPDPKEIAAKREELGKLKVQQEAAHKEWQSAQQRHAALSGNSPTGVVVSSTREAPAIAPVVSELHAAYQSFVGRVNNLDAEIDALSKSNVAEQKASLERQKRNLEKQVKDLENKRDHELEELRHKRDVAGKNLDDLKQQQADSAKDTTVDEKARADGMRKIFRNAAEVAIQKRMEKATERMQKDAAKIVGETFKRELETRWTTTNDKGKVILDADKINTDFSDLVAQGPRFVVTKILMNRGMDQAAAEEYMEKNPDWAKKAEEDLAMRIVSKGLQRQTGFMGREKKATIVDLPPSVVQRIQDSEWGDGILMKAFEWNMQRNEELQQLKGAGITELSSWENFNKWRKRLQKPAFIALMLLLMGGATMGWGTLLSAGGAAIKEGPGFMGR